MGNVWEEGGEIASDVDKTMEFKALRRDYYERVFRGELMDKNTVKLMRNNKAAFSKYLNEQGYEDVKEALDGLWKLVTGEGVERVSVWDIVKQKEKILGMIYSYGIDEDIANGMVQTAAEKLGEETDEE